MDQTVDFSYLYQKRGSFKPGLERIKAAADCLDIDLTEKPRLLIAGTNGKGTTAGYLWQILRSAKFTTGLFTSPHLIHFRERFQIDAEPLADQVLAAELDRIKCHLPAALFESLSFFEINTLLALRSFANAGTDIDILEVGLGGRLDCTNICDALGSVIVSIGEDHQDILGDSLASIAREKAGIIKPGRPVFWGEPENLVATDVVRTTAAQLGAPMVVGGADFGLEQNQYFLSAERSLRPLPNWVRRLPHYLKSNWLLAVKVAADLFQVELEESFVPEATPMCLRGRHQLVQIAHAPYLLDCCHNLQGVEAFARALMQDPRPRPRPALICMLKDKDLGGMVGVLSKVCSPLHAFGIADERSLGPEDLAGLAEQVTYHEDFKTANAAVRHQFPHEEVVICGSVRALGAVLAQAPLPGKEQIREETYHNQ